MAASVRVGSNCSDAVTRSTPSRGYGGRMLSAADVAGGSTLLPTARQQPLDAPFVRRTTSRPITDALSRAAEWARATRAHTGRPSVRIAESPMGRGWRPVLPRGRPACPLGGGGHPPPRRERRKRGAVEFPEVESPEVETPIAQGEEGAGGTEVGEGIEPSPEEMEEWGAGGV